MNQTNNVQNKIQEMADRIVREYNPEKIFLFGSQALGSADAHSDVDLLVVLSPEGSPLELTIQIRKLLSDIGHPKDIIVTTPEKFSSRQNISGTVERNAAQHGILLYERAA